MRGQQTYAGQIWPVGEIRVKAVVPRTYYSSFGGRASSTLYRNIMVWGTETVLAHYILGISICITTHIIWHMSTFKLTHLKHFIAQLPCHLKACQITHNNNCHITGINFHTICHENSKWHVDDFNREILLYAFDDRIRIEVVLTSSVVV